MRTMALLMAGGQGKRMLASGAQLPKPLIAVGGAPLLERALYPLLRAGCVDVVVSVPASIPAVGAFARDRLAALASAAGGALEVVEETHPLGNIGCAAMLDGRADRVLVVYADNVTTLDLGVILDRHDRSGGAMTLAVHEHRQTLPYGHLTLDDVGDIVEYVEKPLITSTVCSAVTVLGPDALQSVARLVGPLDAGIPSGAGLVDLFQSVSASGHRVASLFHEAPWADVNETSSVAAAEAIVRSDPERAELFWATAVEPVDCRIDVSAEARGPLESVLIDDVFEGAPARFCVSTGSRTIGSTAPLAPPAVAARALFHLSTREALADRSEDR